MKFWGKSWSAAGVRGHEAAQEALGHEAHAVTSWGMKLRWDTWPPSKLHEALRGPGARSARGPGT
eukprot:4158366-Alexandrium_andersonii.AAC.1